MNNPAIPFASLAQSVEHAAVNRRVVGSSPTGGAKKSNHPIGWLFCFVSINKQNVNNRRAGFGGFESIKSLESESTVLVGYFKNAGGKNALMLVNCRNIYDPYASQTVTVRFAQKYKVSVYEHGELTGTESTDTLTVTPDSCGGIFIRLD